MEAGQIPASRLSSFGHNKDIRCRHPEEVAELHMPSKRRSTNPARITTHRPAPARNLNSPPCHWAGSLLNCFNSNQTSPSSPPGKHLRHFCSLRRTRTRRWRGSDTASGSRSPPSLTKISRWKPRRINKFDAENPFQLQALNRFKRAALLHPSSCWPKSPEWRTQHIVSAESITYPCYSTPALYTVDRGKSALVAIRIWLCSASRVEQPHRPVSGIPASPAANRHILASFRPPASRALYAILGNRLEVEAKHNRPGWRLAPFGVGCRGGGPVACTVPGRPRRQPYSVEIQALTPRHPNHRASYHPFDASCKKRPPNASKNPEPRSQPIETEEFKRS